MIVSMRDVLLICVCIISITYAEMNGSVRACAGSDVDFLCGINETLDLHLLRINHKSVDIGTYTDTGVDVFPRFKDHYVIVKKTSYIQVRIRDVEKEDKGTLSCTIIYLTKTVKYNWSVIIQEKLTQNVIDFRIKTGICTVLTCNSSSSSELRLKKPDNESIIDQNIVLDSCHKYLPPGEFSCCLMANCSESECKTIKLEEIVLVDSSINYWMIVFVIVSVSMVAIVLIFVWNTRIQKKNNVQSAESRSSEASRCSSQELLKKELTKKFSERLQKQLTKKNSVKSTKSKSSNNSQSSQCSDTGKNSNYRPQQRSNSVRSNESKSSKSSQGSHYSDNFSFINEQEQIAMVSIKRNKNI